MRPAPGGGWRGTGGCHVPPSSLVFRVYIAQCAKFIAHRSWYAVLDGKDRAQADLVPRAPRSPGTEADPEPRPDHRGGGGTRGRRGPGGRVDEEDRFQARRGRNVALLACLEQGRPA